MLRTLTVGVLALAGLVAISSVAEAAWDEPPADGVKIEVTETADGCTISVTPEKVWVESKTLTGKCSSTAVCEVTWKNDGIADFEVTVYPKRWSKQDPADKGRGRKIKKQFNNGDDIGPFKKGKTVTGRPKKQQLLYFRPFDPDKGHYVWIYGVEATNGDGKQCTVDPEVCVRKKGSNGCDT